MEYEEWRVVHDFPKYEVSSQGRIRHVETQDVRKVQINHRGFPTLVLYDSLSPSRYIRQLNKLVAEAFCPPPKYSDQTAVWHENGDLTDCRASNLKWDTRSRVLKWNEMHRTGQPSLRTPRVIDSETGRVFNNAFECAMYLGKLETEIVSHIENYPPQYSDRAKYRYVD